MRPILEARLKQRPSNDPRLDAYLNLKIAAQTLTTLEDEWYAKHDMTIAQMNILRILRGVHPDGHPRYEIAARMVQPAPDITRIIDRMEKKGLVKRERAGVDRRLSVTRITAKGLALLNKIQPEKEEFLSYIAGRLSAKQCEELSDLCERLYVER